MVFRTFGSYEVGSDGLTHKTKMKNARSPGGLT